MRPLPKARGRITPSQTVESRVALLPGPSGPQFDPSRVLSLSVGHYTKGQAEALWFETNAVPLFNVTTRDRSCWDYELIKCSKPGDRILAQISAEY